MNRNLRYFLILVLTLLAFLGCSQAERTRLEIDLMDVVVKEEKSDSGQYIMWEKGADMEKEPPIYTTSIDGFDNIYESGTRYFLVVKCQREERRKVTYIWTGQEWAPRKKGV